MCVNSVLCYHCYHCSTQEHGLVKIILTYYNSYALFTKVWIYMCNCIANYGMKCTIKSSSSTIPHSQQHSQQQVLSTSNNQAESTTNLNMKSTTISSSDKKNEELITLLEETIRELKNNE